MDLVGSHGHSHEGKTQQIRRDSKIQSLWMGGRAPALPDISGYYFDLETL